MSEVTAMDTLVPGVNIFPMLTPEENARRKAAFEGRERDSRLAAFERECPPEMLETRRNWTPPYAAFPAVDWRCFERVQRWAYGPRGLLLLGNTGRGKTRSVWALLRRLAVEESRWFRFLTSVELAAEMEQAHDIGRGEIRRLMGELAGVPILVLDDFGNVQLVGTKATWARDLIFDLVDTRVNYGRPMIVTTNLDINALSAENGALRGEPLMRRLLQSCERVDFGKEKATP